MQFISNNRVYFITVERYCACIACTPQGTKSLPPRVLDACYKNSILFVPIRGNWLKKRYFFYIIVTISNPFFLTITYQTKEQDNGQALFYRVGLVTISYQFIRAMCKPLFHYSNISVSFHSKYIGFMVGILDKLN